MKNELLYNELYERTKEFGRTQFVKLLMEKEREKQELIESLNEKIKKCEELIIKHKQSIKGIVNISDNNRHLIFIKTLGIEKQTYQEILSKIEKR